LRNQLLQRVQGGPGVGELISPVERAKLVGQAELAKLLDISERTLEGWRRRGDGPPFIRLGPKLARYRLDDVKRWLGERRVGNETESMAKTSIS
jgi:phage terminase Nu1 subunit (DNA packaging protein)